MNIFKIFLSLSLIVPLSLKSYSQFDLNIDCNQADNYSASDSFQIQTYKLIKLVNKNSTSTEIPDMHDTLGASYLVYTYQAITLQAYNQMLARIYSDKPFFSKMPRSGFCDQLKRLNQEIIKLDDDIYKSLNKTNLTNKLQNNINDIDAIKFTNFIYESLKNASDEESFFKIVRWKDLNELK